ncbi:hypothetical protein DY000_02057538 [Brassica cretica]|uniref:BCAS3 domain-containing protein n=1 Tax=Brassica cretica TaxID=69181 RepID=A0ABQ7ACA5_BRACR|nr:hypothetical protein DY000_02057538 [Brassica cretica]
MRFCSCLDDSMLRVWFLIEKGKRLRSFNSGLDNQNGSSKCKAQIKFSCTHKVHRVMYSVDVPVLMVCVSQGIESWFGTQESILVLHKEIAKVVFFVSEVKIRAQESEKSTGRGEHGQVVDHDICGGTDGWIKMKDKCLRVLSEVADGESKACGSKKNLWISVLFRENFSEESQVNVNKFKVQHGLIRWRVQCVVIYVKRMSEVIKGSSEMAFTGTGSTVRVSREKEQQEARWSVVVTETSSGSALKVPRQCSGGFRKLRGVMNSDGTQFLNSNGDTLASCLSVILSPFPFPTSLNLIGSDIVR